MKLDHTPSGIKTAPFSEWLDYCILGAEEMGRLTAEDREDSQALYDRPLTPSQKVIRAECKEAAARHITGATP